MCMAQWNAALVQESLQHCCCSDAYAHALT